MERWGGFNNRLRRDVCLKLHPLHFGLFTATNLRELITIDLWYFFWVTQKPVSLLNIQFTFCSLRLLPVVLFWNEVAGLCRTGSRIEGYLNVWRLRIDSQLWLVSVTSAFITDIQMYSEYRRISSCVVITEWTQRCLFQLVHSRFYKHVTKIYF